jgi:serine protease Do
MNHKVKIILISTMFIMTLFVCAKADSISASGSEEKKIEDITSKIFPSVVKVVVRNRTKRVATGVIINKKGHIVTTALVSPRDEEVTVITSQGKRAKAEFLGLDPETYIALLRVKEKGLTPITMGNTKELSPGSWIGVVSFSPENTPAVTQGIVSSVSENSLRLNAWVISGSSGSPVVNKEGHMVGLLRGIYSEDKPIVFQFREKDVAGSGYVYSRGQAPSSGLAKAVPVELVGKIADEIGKKGKVERGWLGVSIADTEEGRVEIVEVEAESPAELANLKKGDTILKVEGKSIVNAKMLVSEIRKRKPGKNITLEVERNGKTLKVKVKLGEHSKKAIKREFELRFPELFPTPEFQKLPPKFPEMPKRKLLRTWEHRKYIGVYLEELSLELSQHLGLKEGRGLFVSKFSEDSPAERAGLKVGDVIVETDGERVETINELGGIIQDKKKGEKVKIKFLRDKKMRTVEVEVKEEERGGIFGWEYYPKSWEGYAKSWEDYTKSMEKSRKKWKDQYEKWQDKYKKELKEIKESALKRISEETKDAVEEIRLDVMRESWITKV